MSDELHAVLLARGNDLVKEVGMSDLTLPLDATVEIHLAGVELAHHIRRRPDQDEWEAQIHYPRTVTTHVDPWHDDPEEWTSLPVPARFADLDAAVAWIRTKSADWITCYDADLVASDAEWERQQREALNARRRARRRA